MVLPWQEKQWRQLMDAVAGDRLPHALLLAGPDGTGLGEFAAALAQTLLCEAPTPSGPCGGECRACVLFKAGNHPDIRTLTPDKAGAPIKVEAVRALIGYFHLSAQYGRRQIAIIEPAEGMNRHAADGLLKTLEEPPPLSLLILVSCQPARLPVTIRSRCQRVAFDPVERREALNWLQKRLAAPDKGEALLELAAGAPLKALELSETDILQQRQAVMKDLHDLRAARANPVEIAKKWQEFDEVLPWLSAIFGDMAKTRCAPGDGAQERALDKLAAGLDLRQLLACHDLALKNHYLLAKTGNLNRQTLLEELVARWQSLKAAPRRH